MRAFFNVVISIHDLSHTRYSSVLELRKTRNVIPDREDKEKRLVLLKYQNKGMQSGLFLRELASQQKPFHCDIGLDSKDQMNSLEKLPVSLRKKVQC